MSAQKSTKQTKKKKAPQFWLSWGTPSGVKEVGGEIKSPTQHALDHLKAQLLPPLSPVFWTMQGRNLSPPLTCVQGCGHGLDHVHAIAVERRGHHEDEHGPPQVVKVGEQGRPLRGGGGEW